MEQQKQISPTKIIVISIGLTLAVSLLFGGIGIIYSSLPTLKAFFVCSGIAFAMQFLIFGLLSVFLDWRTGVKKAEFELHAELALQEQSANLSCAYCRAINSVPILLNRNLQFDCLQCKQTNSVVVQFMTARTTTPITNNPLDKQVDE